MLALGARVKFISVTGKDEARNFSIDRLREYGVSFDIFTDDSRCTSLKKRYRSKGKTLLRVSHLMQTPISYKLQNQLILKAKKAIESCDLLVFSDFNYGLLTQYVVDSISDIAKKNGVLMAADSQSSSQTGNIARFNGMHLITPTEREARLSLRNYNDGLVVIAENLREIANAENIFLTLAEEGVLIHPGPRNGFTDRIEALNKVPRDVAGAGDSLLVTSAMAMACGGNIWESAALGSIAAAIQVGRVGNVPITVKDLCEEIM